MPNAHSDQGQRRHAIRELLSGGPVATQQLLVTELARRGFTATQSSVSRDLREIGAVKTARGYELEPGDSADRPELNAIGEFVRAILPAGPHLLVLRTAIGAAQRVALALDRAGWPEIVGNIGGDDTVFVATDSANHQKILAARLERIVAR
ncbi:MAG: ArgR family transcriptional regulator [Gammaproteobacteria bacterium]|jgi:transcriptional regulator of arginine metabolism|nr:ArgR family transcriptional regulator [Gammaproteobacteria bacterium]MDH3757743.1 ArgR family transcriptional regulator [Gammaproteobacteria bacterium]MDH3847084.1 ArgR family transcriptional regulator [Gammaproteobacteria bacterium]MDH3862944.1 ArgR family transcriptional regulator [Gammaproteobacteria bacterium]MDH3904993.1 ArgR family transcriptional regulator [Gammaproteobacteria bacterium]